MTTRAVPIDMNAEEFRAVGHRLIDRIADHLDSLRAQPVTSGETVAQVREALGRGPLPEGGRDAAGLVEHVTGLLYRHSLYNGHPRFWGFITSSAAPIGVLADVLAASVNPNLGGWILAPIATEIERQTVQWIAELIGYPADTGGLLVSGGNMANFVGFWTGRRVKTPWDLRSRGYDEAARTVRVYASRETHTWIQKAADLSGMGTNAIRWIDTDHQQRMDAKALRTRIRNDRAIGELPLLVVGTAGSVSTGAIDPLGDIAGICRDHNLWFHVDGAYGAPAAALPEADADLKALALADSVAIDPHKWLYTPLEAGCALVRDAGALRDTFSWHPPYYPDPQESAADAPIYYHEYGPQNSRGFRALKVWLGLLHAGRDGAVQMIRDDIRLARRMYDAAVADPELEARTHGLSVTTFRYVPADLAPSVGTESTEAHLDALNHELVERLQQGGELFISNAVIDGRFWLRACIVNFRTTEADVDAMPGIVKKVGREIDIQRRGQRGLSSG
ncbi:MAG: aminotransferase class V-fold PLP-dependent enzyme [Gemmatimonadetes bacterium]|nr:aminotransferase class V-fold PLP-dependent enzyme [Gemmatimonadota bacterium]